jgi:hypothetical protein
MGLPKLDTVAHEALLGVRRMWYMGLRLKFHLRKEKKSPMECNVMSANAATALPLYATLNAHRLLLGYLLSRPQ